MDIVTQKKLYKGYTLEVTCLYEYDEIDSYIKDQTGKIIFTSFHFDNVSQAFRELTRIVNEITVNKC